MKYFDDINLPLLYEVFADVQYEHQRTIVFGENFEKTI